MNSDQELKALVDSLRVKPGAHVSLAGRTSPRKHGAGQLSDAAAKAALEEANLVIADFQSRLAAQGTHGLLVMVQGIDASGKDGAITHALHGINPAGTTVHGFKVPSAEELAHDFLWRFQSKLPRRGEIIVWNRSPYEEVLVVRVHPEHLERQNLPAAARGADVWKRRFREINDWERYLSDNGFHVVKVFLNVSKEEQRKRFLDRIDHPEKNWKFSAADIRERQFWDAYQVAFADALSKTSTTWAPWYIVPADNKAIARLAVAAIIIDELRRIDPQVPQLSPAAAAALAAARQQLIAEAPTRRHGPPADRGL